MATAYSKSASAHIGRVLAAQFQADINEPARCGTRHFDRRDGTRKGDMGISGCRIIASVTAWSATTC